MDLQEHEGVAVLPRLAQLLHPDLTSRLVWGHGATRQRNWVTNLGERVPTKERHLGILLDLSLAAGMIPLKDFPRWDNTSYGWSYDQRNVLAPHRYYAIRFQGRRVLQVVDHSQSVAMSTWWYPFEISMGPRYYKAWQFNHLQGRASLYKGRSCRSSVGDQFYGEYVVPQTFTDDNGTVGTLVLFAVIIGSTGRESLFEHCLRTINFCWGRIVMLLISIFHLMRSTKIFWEVLSITQFRNSGIGGNFDMGGMRNQENRRNFSLDGMWGPQKGGNSTLGNNSHLWRKREKERRVRISGKWGPPRERGPTSINKERRPPFGIF